MNIVKLIHLLVNIILWLAHQIPLLQENFEDNHWQVLKIMEKSSFILLSKDFIIQIDGWP